MFLTTVFEDCLRHAIKDTSERSRARDSIGLSLRVKMSISEITVLEP